MKNSRTLICTVTTAVLFLICAFCINARADEERPILSPAFDVLSAEQRMIKCGIENENVSFTLTDFKQGIGLAEVGYITFSRVPDPTEGYLAVGSMTVEAGQTVYAEMLGMLEFVPASAEIELASFCFSGDEGTSGADIECMVKIIDRLNYAPTAASVHENRLTFSALSGKSTVGTLGAQDPDGDAVRFEIVKYPSHGTITELDRDTGEFSYVSKGSYTGKDGFCYVAVDEYGNYTESVRVNVEVKPDRSRLEFSDEDEIRDLSAASVMISGGVMDAKVQGGAYVFAPELKIKRAEFFVMAMKAAGKSPSDVFSALDTISDADLIPTEAKPYIAAAIAGGYIIPEINAEGEKCLRPDDVITKAEAASFLSKLCGYEKRADDMSVFADFGRVDASMVRSVSAMYEYGVIDCPNGMISPNEQITRDSCARMLYRFMNIEA